MELSKAIILTLGEMDKPVVTIYQLGLIVHDLYKTKSYKGTSIGRLRKSRAEFHDFNKNVTKLLSDGILSRYPGLPERTVFSILGRSHEAAEDVVCTVDPFCYVSHLSAMSFFGLTNRIPNKLIVSSPSPAQWKKFAQEKMEKDLGIDLEDYLASGMPPLRRTKIDKLGRKQVQRVSSIHRGAYRKVREREMRVSTIGRTFLDMLRRADLCGGMNHVIEVYDEHAENNLELIVDEIDRHGKPIDKVRAGYILDEKLKLKHKKINGWMSMVQRGGSRRLDAMNEYLPEWSDKWCISLNVLMK